MAGYNGRKGPNVSQYIADLNTIPSPNDLALPSQDAFLEDDVMSFMNTDFIDWDIGVGDVSSTIPNIDYNPVTEERTRRQNASGFKNVGKTDNFANNNEFQFPDFSTFQPDPSLPGIDTTAPAFPYPTQASPITATQPSPTIENSSDPSHKRKFDSISSPSTTTPNPNLDTPLEEASRFAAEEDKRRRNTAASARFRVKKKQREQALEKTAKEMTDKVGGLETRVSQLEMENKWLKSLITEKNDGTAGDMKEMYEKFARENAVDRSSGGRTDGVGTL